MKKNFKRTLSLVLAVLMVMTAVPLSGLATEGEPCVEHEYIYTPYGAKNHIVECKNCDEVFYREGCTGGTATCGQQAVCQYCERAYGNTPEHNYAAKIENAETLFEAGSNCKVANKYYESCTECGAVSDKEEDIFSSTEKFGPHTWNEGTVTYDDCIANGVRTFKCTNSPCDGTKTEEVDPRGHNFTKKTETEKYLVEGSVATCEQGAEYYFACANENCGAIGTATYFSSKKGAHKFTAIENPEENAILESAATCSKVAVYYKGCSVCHVSAKHVENVENPTFTYGTTHARPSSKAEVCEIFYKKDKDGKLVTDKDGKYIIERDREIIYKATCMEPEKCSYLCAKCGEPLVPAEKYVMGGKYSAEYELYINYQHPALNPNHLLEEKVIDGKKVKLMELVKDAKYWDSTCTEEGKTKTYICLFHEGPDNIVGGEVIPVKEHTYKTEVSKSYRAADCRQAGHQASQSCTTCKTTYYWDKDGKLLKETNTFDPKKAPIDITFDKVSHKDNDGDGLCDLKYINAEGKEGICGLDINTNVVECSCICHKGGFMFIVALILKWFWKLTNSNQYCPAPCGDAHY